MSVKTKAAEVLGEHLWQHRRGQTCACGWDVNYEWLADASKPNRVEQHNAHVAAALAAAGVLADPRQAEQVAAVEALLAPAADDEGLRDHAYYFGFQQTGIGIIDRILSEVCRAGKGYHSTESWQDEDPLVNGGMSYEATIQTAADAAATRLRAALSAAEPTEATT